MPRHSEPAMSGMTFSPNFQNVTMSGELDMMQDFTSRQPWNSNQPGKLQELVTTTLNDPKEEEKQGRSGSEASSYAKGGRRATVPHTSSNRATLSDSSAAPAKFRYSVAGWFDRKSAASSTHSQVEKMGRDPSAFVSKMPSSRRTKEKKLTYPEDARLPKRHKAKIVVWADLTVDAVDRLNESLNADHVKQVLADIFMLDNYKTSVKTGITMDLYYYTLQFARDQGFSPEKTSTFFSIIKKIFEVCIETPFGNLDHTFEYFKDLIHCHTVNRPPYSIELFTPDEVRKITEYTINTFFRHFKMYKYAFTPLVRLDLAISYIGMPPSPPPSEAEVKDEGTQGDDEQSKDEEGKEEEIDEERQAAREELKGIVKNFLTEESKKIEGNVDTQVKAAVEALNSKIDTMIESQPKPEGKGKKK